MKSLNILIGDPGKSNDPFGVIGLEGTWPERKIYIRHARQFKKEKRLYSIGYKDFVINTIQLLNE